MGRGEETTLAAMVKYCSIWQIERGFLYPKLRQAAASIGVTQHKDMASMHCASWCSPFWLLL